MVAVVVASLSACYEYVRSPGTEPEPGTEVRITLTDAGSAALAGPLGPRVESVDGRLTALGPDSAVLGVTQTVQFGGAENTWAGERVAVPRSEIASLTVRRLSASRTALAAVAGAGAIAAAIIGFKVGNPGNGASVHQLPTPK